MLSLEETIRKKYRPVISKTDTHEVGEDLRRIAGKDGLGVAILVAWQHGLKSGHIPLDPAADGASSPQVDALPAGDGCPYEFVHVPVRQFRRNKPELVRRRIMNQDADPALFTYHEDGLVGTFSFQDPQSVGLAEDDLREILDAFFQQGVLVRANVNNRQIHFKNLMAKRRIEESAEKVYVRADDRPLHREAVGLPPALHRPEVWDYVEDALRFRSSCNYCSVQALTPRQVTIHTARVFTRATVRNYQLGFTFAPVGDPESVCHFLAWDFPHINDLVMNMEPQAYSFSDLIRLVRVINRDVERFCRVKKVEASEPVSGACNHWAGNSLYHQHYQFFRIAGLPLLAAGTAARPLVTYRDVEVRKVARWWPSPAYLITSSTAGRDEDVMRVADRVAREWQVLSEGEDWSYGNGIAIRNHTQNIFVTTDADSVSAIFIPRDRRRINTADPGNPIQKSNAGVLEMLGYFVIDDPRDFATLKVMSRRNRKDLKNLGDSWLRELAPDAEAIREFEANVRICLSDVVTPHEERIEMLRGEMVEDPRQEAWTVTSCIQRDRNLNHRQREHLYRELLSAVLESSAAASARRSPEP
jgi:hypothetical protein